MDCKDCKNILYICTAFIYQTYFTVLLQEKLICFKNKNTISASEKCCLYFIKLIS